MWKTALAAGGLLILLAGCTTREPAMPTNAAVADLHGVYLYSNGWVTTAPGAQPEKLTIAVRDGRVLRVGPDADFDQWRALGVKESRIDGNCVFPGMTDAHGHLESLGKLLDTIPLGDQSLAEILQRLAQTASELRAAGRERDDVWVQGRGWDQNQWADKSFPSRSDLDKVCPINPVFLVRVDGHAAWLNSAALEKAGIGTETPDPEGGRILRDADGRPTGVLIDRAVDLAEKVIPPPDRATIRRRLEIAFDEVVHFGLTEVHDAGVEPEVLSVLEEMAEKGELPIRVYAMLLGDADHDWLAHQYALGPRKVGAHGELVIRAVKFYLDGALGSRGAALFDDYSDDPGNRGLLLMEPDDFRKRAEEAVRAGFQVAVHAIGDRANHIALDTFEALRPIAGKDPRFRIEHAQIVDPKDIPRFAKLGVVASMQPTHATSDMTWAEDRLGPNRLAGAYAWHSLLESGAHLAGGSDFPVESADPTLGIWAAISRQDLEGAPAGGWLPQEKITFDQALAMFTTGAAYAAFEEKERGRIAPGYLADFTLYRWCLMADQPGRIAGAPVTEIVVAGKVVDRR